MDLGRADEGKDPLDAGAMTEAWEEAGVRGKVKSICLGIYSYSKEREDGPNLPCVVAVFPVRVDKLEKTWPESKERKRKWFALKKAAGLVREPELAAMLKKFEPSGL